MGLGPELGHMGGARVRIELGLGWGWGWGLRDRGWS